MKNSKLILIALFSAFLVNGLVAQEMKWGGLQSSKWKNYHPKLIGDDSENVYSYFFEGSKLHLTAFSRSQWTPIYEKEVPELIADKEKVRIEKISVLEDNYIIIGSYFHKKKIKKGEKSRKYHIVAYTAEKNTGKVNATPVKLFDIEVDNKFRKGDYDVYVTPDKTKILINHTAWYKKKKKTVATFKLYDDDLELIEEFTEDFGKKNDVENSIDKINNLIVDNEGSIYYLAGLGKFVSLDANRNYEKWEEDISIEKLAPNGSITNSVFTFDDEGNILIFGFYNEVNIKNKGILSRAHGGLKGVFHLKLDYLTKEVSNAKISDFNKTFLDNLKSKRQKKREAKGKSNYVRNIFNLIDLTVQKDGSLAVVAESYSYRYVSSDNADTETIQYNDVAVLNLSPEGDLKWANYLPKKQLFQQTSNGWLTTGTFNGGLRLLLGMVNSYHYTKYFSTVSGVKEGKIVVVYNNHLKNLPETPKKKLKPLTKVKKANVEARIYDIETGSFEVKKVKKGNQKEAPFAPRIYYRTSDGKSLVVFGQKKKNFKFGELMLD